MQQFQQERESAPRRAWRAFRSWPWWAQGLAGLVLASVAVGPFVSDDNAEQPGQPVSTATTAAAPAVAPISGLQVVDAVTAAGLAVPNPRDNTAGTCDPADPGMLACTEVLTTDLFTVRVWATPGDAQHWADVGAADPPIVLHDLTTVDLHEGGSTPPYDRAAYEAAITTLV